MPEFSAGELIEFSLAHAEQRVAAWLEYTKKDEGIWDYYQDQRGGSCQ